MILLWLLFVLFLPGWTLHPSTQCSPCRIPSPAIQWLSTGNRRCFEPGDFLFHLAPAECPDGIIEAADWKKEGDVAIASRSLCIGDTPSILPYRVHCGSEWQQRTVRIAKKRSKRWIRRRNPPQAIHFQQERYVKEVSEDASTNEEILTVKAWHSDGRPLVYSMVAPQDSRSRNTFSLDTISGQITLVQSLDRETLDKHVLKVTAADRLDASVSASTTVTIVVLDIQDNSPRFERESYFAEIREDAAIGTTVVSVFARDLDEGANGEVRYSIEASEGTQLLAIHPSLGVIQTAAFLDRENLSVIRFSVIATDKGAVPRSSSSFVQITVLDVNDNAPVFSEDSYNVSVMENTTVPSVIGRVSATDADEGKNGEVHYSLAAPSTHPITVDYSTGEISLREPLLPAASEYFFLIRAKDSAIPARSTIVSLNINVIDINDHAPVFIASQRVLMVEEGTAKGHQLSHIVAMDQDIGENGRIRYFINGTDDVEIDEATGVIRAVEVFDRETTPRYEVQVTATDCGSPPLSASFDMTIIVTDINDNSPVFPSPEIHLNFTEGSPRGTKLCTVKATDADDNDHLIYRIESATYDIISLIDLGEEGALLSLLSPLKRAHNGLRVVVSATDEGGLSGQTTVVFSVHDVNSPPSFPAQPLVVHVPEDIAVGSTVLVVRADEYDEGENARVVYSLSPDTHFAIDAITGVVTVVQELDREVDVSFSLSVTARDHGRPPLSTSTLLDVILDDVNDNAPEFSSSVYATTVSEDIPVGTSFLAVAARDADVGENGVVDFFLDETSWVVRLDLFRLDRTSGTLRVNAPLDRENISRLELPVIARDHGRPSLEAKAVIVVSLTDVNDNAPVFDQPSYDLAIAENSPPGSRVGSLTATDIDEGENAVIEFRIFGGTDARLFDIQAEGNTLHILSRVPFDYEAKLNRFDLEIQATSGQLSTTTTVHVRVSDVNDNPPQLADFVLLVVHHSEAPFDARLPPAPAVDPDHNATLEYSLADNRFLDIDKYTGHLSLKRIWRTNIETAIKTTVSDGATTVSAKCLFVYSFIDKDWLMESVTVQVNVSLDEFLQPEYFRRFRQSLSIGNGESSVMIVALSASSESLLISFVVLVNQKIIRGHRVREELEGRRLAIERILRSAILIRGGDTCRREPCPYYNKCRETVRFMGEHEIHTNNYFISRTLSTLETYSCECPVGFSRSATGQCDSRLDQCYSNPCKHNGTCVPLEAGFRCDCALGWRGAQCDISTIARTCLPGFCHGGSECDLSGNSISCVGCRHMDADARCRLRGFSVEGNGMVMVHRQIGRMQWTLSLSFSTIAHDGILLFVGNISSDFLQISLKDRLVTAEFSVGDKTERVSVNERVNDGQWHRIDIFYYHRELTMALDGCDWKVSSIGKGRECAASRQLTIPDKCADLSVPCYRFLDVPSEVFLGARPSSLRRPEGGFIGCLSNFTIDGSAVFLNDLDSVDRIGEVENECPMGRCKHTEGCQQRWKGTKHNRKHNDEKHSWTLYDEESFLSWEIPSWGRFHVHLEFSARESSSQILSLHSSSSSFVLSLVDGILHSSIMSNLSSLLTPEIRKFEWTSVDLKFDEEGDVLVITVDQSYSFNVSVDLEGASLSVGMAPSTSHPARFRGCIRHVTINGEKTAPSTSAKIRPGCSRKNGCPSSGCPLHSRCHDGNCECLPGFVGGACEEVCALGVCGEGECRVDNSTRGYVCVCPPGRLGGNCEWEGGVRECPPGWFGSFPFCRECSCDRSRGMVDQCDRVTGECSCPPGFFLSLGTCSPCECGPASTSSTCSPSGQCHCVGEAVGRRCDRCPDVHHVLDASSLTCSLLEGSCPSQTDSSIHWPIIRAGHLARVPCPSPQMGIATRLCREDATWDLSQLWNCTHPEVSTMLIRMNNGEWKETVESFVNTTAKYRLTGRNLILTREVMERVLEWKEGILEDGWLVGGLITSSGRVLSQTMDSYCLSDVHRLFSFGRELFARYHSFSVSPLQISSADILFSIDSIRLSDVLPKFDHFVDERPSSFPRVHILPPPDVSNVFYVIFRPLECVGGVIAVGVHHTSPRPTRVVFPVDGALFPECVLWLEDEWSRQGASLITVNETHSTCEFAFPGVYAVLADKESAFYVRAGWSYTCTVSLALSWSCLAVSIVLTECRPSVGSRLIRIVFAISILLLSIAFSLLHRMSINEVFCPSRNAVLSLVTVLPFAWIFLYSLHIFRLMSDAESNSNVPLCVFVGVVFPCLLSLATFWMSMGCSLDSGSWLYWLLLLPICLFLLMTFHSLLSSLILSRQREYAMCSIRDCLYRILLYVSCLILLTLLYVSVNVFVPRVVPLEGYLSDALLVCLSLSVLLWSAALPVQKLSSMSGGLWLVDQQEGGCQSPLLDRYMPDVIPPPDCRRVPSILSPPKHILNETHEAEVPREKSDDLDHAYYTYTRRHPQSTFYPQ